MDVTITLTGVNGDVITFDNETYVLVSGVKGFGVPATKVRIAEAATEGGVFRFSKRGIREIDLPVTVLGSDRADVETKLRRLANVLQNTQGATRLSVAYDSGETYWLDTYYMGGAETVYGSDAGATFANWTVTVQAPQPFWESTATSTFTVGAGNSGRSLIPQLSRLKLSSSQALGSVTVTNSGDVPAYPVWTIRGPLSTLSIVQADGTGFSYASAIATGEIIVIDTYNGTVEDASGVNKYGNLGTAPKLFPINPGTTTIAVTGTGATSSTGITCNYHPRKEVVH